MAGIVSNANLGGVADARLGDEADAIGTTDDHRAGISHDIQSPEDEKTTGEIPPPDTHGHNTIYLDNSISFESYHYWANRSRAFEKHIRTDNAGYAYWGNLIFGKKIKTESPTVDNSEPVPGSTASDEKKSPSDEQTNGTNGGWAHGITESEWEQAQRATRTATWGSIFYLITTDILGPFNVPWAIAQMGYGPGFALYTSFGVLAYYSGMQLWKMFVGLDSTRYPMRNYGDVAFRIYGNWARVGVNFLQSFQFFLNVALIITSSGQGLAQMAVGASGNGFLCFVVAEVIFMLLGFLLGQIRTLQRLSWLSNMAVWLNIIVIIMTMVVVHQYPPNYDAALTSFNIPEGPIITTANWPPDTTLYDRINGLMNCVFAYGGATLFNELMAEMRRPYDFWKGFIIAEVFIYACYLIMGMVVYSAQGQFSFPVAYQGIPNSAYRFQTLGNAVSFISALIAALLYGNIGIKVFYSAILQDVFRLPPLNERFGKLLWIALVPLYWGGAFIIAAAVPQIANLISFVGALCIMQFSYTFPPLLLVGYNCQKDAMLPEEAFDPRSGQAVRVDEGWTRWIRGYKKKWALNTFDILYFLAALATAGLGLWASITGMHKSFSTTAITPFTCKNPAG
jgi:hypothetical protein